MNRLVNRFEKIAKRYAPSWLETLSPGADEDTLKAYRATFSDPNLPGLDTWLAMHAWRDGSMDWSWLWEGNDYLSLASSLSLKSTMDSLEADGTFDRWAPNEWWNPAWVPIFDDHSYDTFVIDTEGCFGGKPGQIVSWSKDSAWRSASAPSFDAWLTAFCELILDRAIRWGEDGGFQSTRSEMIEEMIASYFDAYPLGQEARTRLELGLERIPKPPERVHLSEGYDIQLISQVWAPEQHSVQALEWCDQHGLAVGINAFDDIGYALSLVDPATGDIRQHIHQGEGCMSIRWMPEHETIAYLINAAQREIWTYHIPTQTRRCLWQTGETRMYDMFDVGGAYVMHAGRHVRVMDIRGGQEPIVVPVEPDGKISAALSPSGANLAIHRPDGPMMIFDTATMICIEQFEIDLDYIKTLIWSDDGARIIATNYRFLTRQWSPAGASIALAYDSCEPYVLVTHGDLLLSAGYSGAVECRDGTGELIYSDDAHHHARVYGLAVDRQNHIIYSGGDDGQLASRQINL